MLVLIYEMSIFIVEVQTFVLSRKIRFHRQKAKSEEEYNF